MSFNQIFLSFFLFLLFMGLCFGFSCRRDRDSEDNQGDEESGREVGGVYGGCSGLPQHYCGLEGLLCFVLLFR